MVSSGLGLWGGEVIPSLPDWLSQAQLAQFVMTVERPQRCMFLVMADILGRWVGVCTAMQNAFFLTCRILVFHLARMCMGLLTMATSLQLHQTPTICSRYGTTCITMHSAYLNFSRTGFHTIEGIALFSVEWIPLECFGWTEGCSLTPQQLLCWATWWEWRELETMMNGESLHSTSSHYWRDHVNAYALSLLVNTTGLPPQLSGCLLIFSFSTGQAKDYVVTEEHSSNKNCLMGYRYSYKLVEANSMWVAERFCKCSIVCAHLQLLQWQAVRLSAS